MPWSGGLTTIRVPFDATVAGGRNYIDIGEDVPAEVAGGFTAGLVFRSGNFDPDNAGNNYPNGFAYWIFGITTLGALEIVAVYYTVASPLATSVTYYRRSILASAPPAAVDSPPTLALGTGRYAEGPAPIVSLALTPPTRLAVGAGPGWATVNNPVIYIDVHGRKFLQGWLQNVGAFTPAGGEWIGSLPAYFPPATRFFVVPVSIGQTTMQIQINPTGTISIARPSSVFIAAGAVWSLDGINYD